MFGADQVTDLNIYRSTPLLTELHPGGNQGIQGVASLFLSQHISFRTLQSDFAKSEVLIKHLAFA
jgi:hypothetical protein